MSLSFGQVVDVVLRRFYCIVILIERAFSARFGIIHAHDENGILFGIMDHDGAALIADDVLAEVCFVKVQFPHDGLYGAHGSTALQMSVEFLFDATSIIPAPCGDVAEEVRHDGIACIGDIVVLGGVERFHGIQVRNGGEELAAIRWAVLAVP